MTDGDDIIGRSERLVTQRQPSYIFKDNNTFLLDPLHIAKHRMLIVFFRFHDGKNTDLFDFLIPIGIIAKQNNQSVIYWKRIIRDFCTLIFKTKKTNTTATKFCLLWRFFCSNFPKNMYLCRMFF